MRFITLLAVSIFIPSSLLVQTIRCDRFDVKATLHGSVISICPGYRPGHNSHSVSSHDPLNTWSMKYTTRNLEATHSFRCPGTSSQSLVGPIHKNGRPMKKSGKRHSGIHRQLSRELPMPIQPRPCWPTMRRT